MDMISPYMVIKCPYFWKKKMDSKNFCFKIWNFCFKKRDCPSKIGTVGKYGHLTYLLVVICVKCHLRATKCHVCFVFQGVFFAEEFFPTEQGRFLLEPLAVPLECKRFFLWHFWACHAECLSETTTVTNANQVTWSTSDWFTQIQDCKLSKNCEEHQTQFSKEGRVWAQAQD